jgi:beta-glucosidase
MLPSLDYDIINSKGSKGWDATWHSHDADDKPLPEPVKVLTVDETYIFISNSSPPTLTERWTMKLRAKMIPRAEDTLFEYGLMVAGRAKLYIDGQLVIDNWTWQRRGVSFFMTGTEEERGKFLLKKGVAHELYLEFCNVRGPADGDEGGSVLAGGPGVRLGGCVVVDGDQEIEKAVSFAKDADVAVVIIGLNADWETEGNDRTTLKLPGRTDELVTKVAAVNPSTVVITQSVSLAIQFNVDRVF